MGYFWSWILWRVEGEVTDSVFPPPHLNLGMGNFADLKYSARVNQTLQTFNLMQTAFEGIIKSVNINTEDLFECTS